MALVQNLGKCSASSGASSSLRMLSKVFEVRDVPILALVLVLIPVVWYQIGISNTKLQIPRVMTYIQHF